MKKPIRGENTTTHSLESVDNILLNIIPKYIYCKNIVFLNYSSIRRSTGFQITEIGYEYNYIQLSSSKRDMDQNSEWDKYESYAVKKNEALYLQNKVNAERTMESIEYLYGPFDDDEVSYYKEKLMNDKGEIINGFQKNLIFNLFYKYFGDPTSIYSINKDDYVKLMIAAKNMLLANNMIILPYVISSKVERLQTRKCINKKELVKLESSSLYNQVRDKYKDEKVETQILSIIATILASDFRIIDFYNDEVDGRLITNIPDLIGEEIMMYITMI